MSKRSASSARAVEVADVLRQEKGGLNRSSRASALRVGNWREAQAQPKRLQ